MNDSPDQAGRPSASADEPVVLFDGVCDLCNGFVLFVIRRDRRAAVRFGALQSTAAVRLLREAETPQPIPDSIVLIEGGRSFTRSGAVLRVFRHLRFPWPLCAAFLVVPRPLRDWVYDWIARRRHRWFGRRASCMMPTADLARRFLDERSG